MIYLPIASVVVNNFNYGRFIADAIDSALAQTHPNTEVIVVDDGSTDESRDIIAGYGSGVTAVLKTNGGQASAFNAGFAASHGEVVIFLDADDTLSHTAVERAVELFAQPNVVKVHWPLWRVDRHGRKTGKLVPDRPLIEGDLRDLALRYGPETYESPPNSPPTSGNAWSRRFLAHVLPIPEAEFKWGADAYLFTLASIFGVVRAVGEPQGCYRVHGSNDTLKPLEQYMADSLARYEHCCEALGRYLRELGTPVDPSSWKRETWFHRIDASLRDFDRVLPEGSAFILVDGHQWGTGEFVVGRRRIPFLERAGQYWGAPPDDATAIRELGRLRSAGASHIIFAWPAFWWFEYYAGLRRYLRASFACVLENERLVVFQLGSDPQSPPQHGEAVHGDVTSACPSGPSSAP